MNRPRRRGIALGPASESAPAEGQLEGHAKMAGRLATAAVLARDPELRQQMIATGAYLRAKGRGFAAGSELEDWLEAEKEVDRRLMVNERQTSAGTSS